MRVFLRGRCVRMAQQLANDGQTEAKACANARVGVAKIVDAQPFKARSLDDSAPRPIQIGARFRSRARPAKL